MILSVVLQGDLVSSTIMREEIFYFFAAAVINTGGIKNSLVTNTLLYNVYIHSLLLENLPTE